MNSNGEKIVKFDAYCPTCKYKDLSEAEDKCHYCLQHPVNYYTHRPTNYEDKE